MLTLFSLVYFFPREHATATHAIRVKRRVKENTFNTFNTVYLYFILRHSHCFPLMILKFKNRFDHK